MSRDMGVQEIMSNFIDYHLNGVYTSMPGVVVTVRNKLNEMSVDVQPALSMRTEDADSVTPRPTILNVPFHMPLTDQGGLSYPISVGTPVWLVFSMRGLEKWKRSDGKPDAPTDLRKFDARDCIAIPGAWPAPISKNNPKAHHLNHSTDDVVLVHNIGKGSEVEIRLKPDGDVFINSPKKVTVNCIDAQVNAENSIDMNTNHFSLSANTSTVDTDMEFTGSFVLNGITMETHRHPENDSGGPTDGPIN